MAKKNTPSKEHLQFLKEVLSTNQIDLQFEISVCINDIPRDKMVKASNKKIYVDLVVAPRKEPDQWRRDLKVYCKPTASDREKQQPKNYVGGGRMITFASGTGENPTDDELSKILDLQANDQKNVVPY